MDLYKSGPLHKVCSPLLLRINSYIVNLLFPLSCIFSTFLICLELIFFMLLLLSKRDISMCFPISKMQGFPLIVLAESQPSGWALSQIYGKMIVHFTPNSQGPAGAHVTWLWDSKRRFYITIHCLFHWCKPLMKSLVFLLFLRGIMI